MSVRGHDFHQDIHGSFSLCHRSFPGHKKRRERISTKTLRKRIPSGQIITTFPAGWSPQMVV